MLTGCGECYVAGYLPQQQPLLPAQNYPAPPPGSYPTQPTMPQYSYPTAPPGSYPTQPMTIHSADPNAPPSYAAGKFYQLQSH